MTRILSLGLPASLLAAGVVFAAPGKATTPPAPPAPPVPVPAPAAVTPSADEAVFKSQEAETVAELIFDDLEAAPLPEGKAFGGKKGDTQEETETAKRLKAIPVGKSWLEGVVIADTIGNDDERKKAFNEEVKTIQNRINGAIRRFRKADPSHALRSFTVAKVMDEKRGYGVRVYRNEDNEPKVETPATA